MHSDRGGLNNVWRGNGAKAVELLPKLIREGKRSGAKCLADYSNSFFA